MTKIDFHADDYALSTTNSQHIIECIKKGKLNSISIIPNTNSFSSCMELLSAAWESFPEKPLIAVHLNFIDGFSLSQEYLSLLQNNNKYLDASWGKLFLSSLFPSKRRTLLKSQLKLEIAAQINAVQSALPAGCTLRIDSHMHTHMIPVVAKALLEVIDEHQYPVTYIRVAQEPILLFLKKASLYKTYSFINFIKNIILNILSIPMKKELERRQISYGLLWGLVMSGNMDKERIDILYNDFAAYAKKKNNPLEILFHPGQVLPTEIAPENHRADVNAFYLSDLRNIEKKALLDK